MAVDASRAYFVRSDLDEEAERQAIDELLEAFREACRKEKETSFKFDMVAFANFNRQGRVRVSALGRHPRGVKPGFRFEYRAEAAVCGAHRSLVRGIDFDEGCACNAIVLAGRYEGDDDHGAEFIYSGEGGISEDTKKADQTWTKGNRALQRSYQKGIPVKVVRGIKEGSGTSSRTAYFYDGLYLVKEAYRQEKDGNWVCLFRLEGIPGQFTVSGRVEVSELYPGGRRMAVSRGRPRKRTLGFEPAYGHMCTNDLLLKLEHERAAFLDRKKHVMFRDISGGKEAIMIPLVNDTGEEVMPPDFRYITSLCLTTPEADALIEEAEACRVYTGCQKRKNAPYYDSFGCLVEMQPEGIRECPLSCKGCKNSVVTTGIRYPLEVFRTLEKGWGVRCSVDIPIGAFICEYVGKILTDHEVENGIGSRDSAYLYSLDHFYQLLSGALHGREDIDREKMPPLPLSDEDIKNEKFHDRFLVIDARENSNIGRFVNHACSQSANALPQMVLKQGCTGVFHHVALFAARDIPMYVEITFDYGWIKSLKKGVQCRCGLADCKG